ncbi:mannose-1-phosphate guanylyltransferase [Mobiluncus porci]|uniref:Mannose-1-phosphate guanylyltransferase n=1 Tax=Mobiluncus porci TaxID=2652278 RepID=A0A7K0K4X6_9ACTO|nr:sugar phosphate nucleotidyltransferase [Mobiluncus porci]MST50506.1 mannose-1-phosphate guanylyltransferase [Mobiluncus porci]
MDFHAIIPAGGAGRRLWPWSTPSHPKFLLPLGSEKSLLQTTATRLAPLAQSLTFVTGSSHAEAVRRQIGSLNLDTPSLFVAEPAARDSMAAIGLGAALIERDYGPSLAGSFAADHHIGGVEAFHNAVAVARAGAEAGKLVTIGITPSGPETGYGYIEVGEPIPEIPGLHLVNMFKEKPDAKTASAYLESGGYLWNAGMFVFRTDVLLGALEQEAPESASALRKLAANWESLGEPAKLAWWEKVVRAPIDTVLAEPMSERGEVVMVPAAAAIDWSDVGDWEAIYQLRHQTGEKLANLSPQTPVFQSDSPDSLVYAPGLQGVAVIGIPHAVVVESGGKLLVTTRENAQKVKAAGLAADEW